MNKNKFVAGYLFVGGGLIGLASGVGVVASLSGALPADVDRTNALVSGMFGLLIASVNIYAGSIVWDA
jgi:hypothetical protein